MDTEEVPWSFEALGANRILEECPIKPKHISAERISGDGDLGEMTELNGVILFSQAINPSQWHPIGLNDYNSWCVLHNHSGSNLGRLIGKRLLERDKYGRYRVTRELAEMAFRSAPATDQLPRCYPQLMLGFQEEEGI